jgi:hypothetical protein
VGVRSATSDHDDDRRGAVGGAIEHPHSVRPLGTNCPDRTGAAPVEPLTKCWECNHARASGVAISQDQPRPLVPRPGKPFRSGYQSLELRSGRPTRRVTSMWSISSIQIAFVRVSTRPVRRRQNRAAVRVVLARHHQLNTLWPSSKRCSLFQKSEIASYELFESPPLRLELQTFRIATIDSLIKI